MQEEAAARSNITESPCQTEPKKKKEIKCQEFNGGKVSSIILLLLFSRGLDRDDDGVAIAL